MKDYRIGMSRTDIDNLNQQLFMKQIRLKITKGLKCALMAATLAAGAFAATKLNAQNGLSFAVAGFALVAKAKQKNPDMTAEEEAGLKMLEDEINNHFKGLIDETALKAKIDEISAKFADKTKYDELLETVKEQANLIDQVKSALRGGGASGADNSIKGQLKAFLESEDGKRGLDAMRSKRGGMSMVIDLKAATTLTVGSNTTDASPFGTRIEIEAGVTDQVRNQPFIADLLNVRGTNAPTIYWVEKENADGQAQFIGEGDLKPLVDFDFKKVSSEAKKIAAVTKASTEMLEDIDGMAGLITDEILYQIAIEKDTQIISGDGTGDNPRGIDYFGGAYVLTTITTPTPNLADCIIAVATQIRNLHFNPNIAIVNPIDATNLQLEKDGGGQYIIPPFTTANGMTVAGLKVVESPNVAVGSLRVLDTSKINYRPYKTVTITWGWENDDFRKNLVTVIGEERFHFYVKSAHTGAIVDDTIANVMAAIAEV